MKRDGARYLIDSLENLGVHHLFGNPGTTELPIVRSIADSNLEYILALHEDIAVGMAAGYAIGLRHLDRQDRIPPLGVINLHVGPGVAHGLCNVYNAFRAGAPLLVTAGNHATTFQSAEPLLSGDLVQMTEQFTKWSAEVGEVDALPTYLQRAIETALTPPTGPVFLSLPLDIQTATCEAQPIDDIDLPPESTLDHVALDETVQAVLAAEEPVLVVGDRLGQGGSDSIDAAVEFAETVGARVHDEVLAAEVNFPQDHDLWVSPLPPDEDRIKTLLDTDTIVFAGVDSITPLTEPSGDLIDPDTTILTLGYRDIPGLDLTPQATLNGDPGNGLSALNERLTGEIATSTTESRRDAISAIKTFVDAMLDEMAAPVAPVDDRLAKPEVVEVLHEVIPDGYLVDESVTASFPLRAEWNLEPGRYLFSKGSGLGYGAAAALGVGLTGDDIPVVGFIGDGSYLYYPQVAYTALRHDIDVTLLVVDNQSYSILKRNMRSMFDEVSEDEFIGMDLSPPVDISDLAGAQGVSNHRANTQEELHTALEEAINEGGPSVVVAEVHD